jgi:peptide/nickel transport system substrate-binding protein
LGILAYSAASVLNRQWAIAQGCWNGRIADAANYNNPAPGSEPLQKIANGTGPYRLKQWEPSKQFIFERFDAYWGPAPALRYAIIKYVKEWSTRKLMLQNGDADRVTVDMPYVPEVRAMKGLKLHEVTQLSVSFALFCQNVDPTANPNIGSGKLDGKGIPPDFFADLDVRKAFLHAMDRRTYEQDVFNGLVIMPTSPVIEGLPYHHDTPVYDYDLEKAREYLQQAFDGRLWQKGFHMVIAYNTGNDMRAAAALMLAENIMSLNPKFTIEVRNVEWKDYVVQYRSFMFPIFITGWVADYADPHNFVHAFMHSRGVYGRFMGYQNPEADRLIAAGVITDAPDERDRIYRRLQQIWYQDAVGIALYQQINIRAYRDWVQGYVPNPMLSDAWEDLKRLRKV